MIDLTGRKFERLTVLEMAGHRNKEILWLCRCECGNEKTIRGWSVERALTTPMRPQPSRKE